MTRYNSLAAFVYEGSAFVQRATAWKNHQTYRTLSHPARRYATFVVLTPAANSVKKRAHMSQWNVNAWKLFILGCVTCLMLLIVVLPDADLPDTAFHRGTAPAVIHAQATAAPFAVTLASVNRSPDAGESSRPYDSRAVVGSTEPNFRPILLRSLRC